MDRMPPKNDQQLLKAAAAALEKTGLAAHCPEPGRLVIRHGDQTVQGRVLVRRNLRPGALGAILHELQGMPGPAILVADHVSPPMADRLRELGVEFLDLAGNAYLNQPPLLVWVKGETRRLLPAQQPRTTGLTRAGWRVVFTLLCRPDLLDAPYRALAREAGVAHGTVGGAMVGMEGAGYLVRVGKRRRLSNPKRLLIEWAEVFGRDLRPRMLWGRFRLEHPKGMDALLTGRHDYRVGGELAEARLTGHLRPAGAALYGPRPDAEFLAAYRLRPDPQGLVELLDRFWRFETEDRPLAPLPLIYADLLQAGDARGVEAAEQLYQRIVDGLVTPG